MGFFNKNTAPAPVASATPMQAVRSVNLVKDPTGKPAVNLTKVREGGHVDLVKRADKAGISLSKRGLSGIRAQARLYVDHSQSMEFAGAKDYTNGNVQRIVERALAFALQIDVDGTIPVFAFDSQLWPEVNVGYEADLVRGVEDYRDIVNRKIWRRNDMGGTAFVPILQDIKREAESTNVPLFCIIVTDGSPGDRNQATQLVKELAAYPVFLKFLAIRDVDYLAYLDDMDKREPGCRLLDNVDRKAFDGQPDGEGGLNPDPISVISDLNFADAMADEWDTWVTDATAKGVLR